MSTVRRPRGDTLGPGGPTTTPVRPRSVRGGAALLLLLASVAGVAAPTPARAEARAYVSPAGGIQAALLALVESASVSVDVAIFDFTAGRLADALLRARERGVAVRIVADARQARGRRSVLPRLSAAGVAVHLVHGRGRGIMHDKFAVFDARRLVTGSYNWTDSAERANFENALVLDDPRLVARYADAFERLFARPPVSPIDRPGRSRPTPAARSSGS